MRKAILCILFIVITTALATFGRGQLISQDTVSKDSIPLLSPIYHPNNIPKTTFYPDQKNQETTITKKTNQNSAAFQTSAAPASISAVTDAGRTNAAIDISPTGAATYSVPIALPPGINGVSPQVALTYNSQSGNGIAGYGWNISGISVISRIPATKFHDNRTGSINYDTNDRFALDGQRLILKSGTYGADGAVYETESFSNIRITSKGTSTYGPRYFEVNYPDGSSAFYGFYDDARTPTEYAISYSVNPLGVQIGYGYYNTNNSLAISIIFYGGVNNGLLTPKNNIYFNYKTLQRKEQAWVNGQSVYRNQILADISVVANNVTYRNYILTHNQVSSLNYERLVSITELNGDKTKSFEPITFNYDNSVSSLALSTTNVNVSNIERRNSEVVAADFTGDGSMDFIVYDKQNKNRYWVFWDPTVGSSYTEYGTQVNSSVFEEILPVSWLTSNNKLYKSQAFVVIKHIDEATIKFEVNSAYTVSPVLNQYEKIWSNLQTTGYFNDCEQRYIIGDKIPRKFLSGDFNGDGLTDVISINKPYNQMYGYTVPDCITPVSRSASNATNAVPPPTNCCLTNTYPVDFSTVHFINLDRRLTSNFIVTAGSLLKSYSGSDQLYTADFNGDGKTDIIHVTEGKIYVYGLDDNNNLILLKQQDHSRITLNYQPLVGDFNGDGKIDILFPTSITAPQNEVFVSFISNGKEFGIFEKIHPFKYANPNNWNSSTGMQTLSDLIAVDVNGDGKTDILRTQTTTWSNLSHGIYFSQIFQNNNVYINGNPTFVTGPLRDTTIILKHYSIPIFLTSEKPNFGLEYGLISNNQIAMVKAEKDIRRDAIVRSINQDGINYTIDYANLVPETYSAEIPIYSEGYNQTFPFLDIAIAPGLKVVKRISRSFNGVVTKQVFGYRAAVSNTEGLGFLGFTSIIKSNWYQDTDINRRFFTTSIHNPQLRGAVIKSFVSKTADITTSISDISQATANINLNAPVPNAQTQEASQSVILSPGFNATGSNGVFIAKITNPATGVNDGASTANYISRTDYTYQTDLSASKVFTNLPVSVATKDLLSNTNTTVGYTYDEHKNVIKEFTNYSGIGNKTVTGTYGSNLAVTGYYIGRPLTKRTVMSNAIDNYSTEEQYTYTGFLPTTIKKKGHNTPFITENIQYDQYGNSISKTITSPSGLSRTTQMEYDASGRFMTKSIDVEGLATTRTYNTSNGNVTTETNPYGQTSTYNYDAWGRLAQTTDYLNVNAYRTYTKVNSNILTTEWDDEGNRKETLVNAMGQTIESKTRDVLGQMVGQFSEYDPYDRVKRQSEPGISGAYSQWNETIYDEYSRVKQAISFTGKVTTMTYNGLSVTANDGTKSVTTTKDALDNVISTQDPGGTINNTYYANGNLKLADYQGSVQSIEQDGWGRKIKLTDPSAGIYTYEYNDLGETTKETTPKGNTVYTYDAVGKLQTKRIQGDGTDMSYTYTYDGSTKLITSSNLSNADGNNTAYTYTYDTHKRVATMVEDNAYAIFTKAFAYDSYGRVNTETSTAKNKANNKSAAKTIRNNYQYGQVKSISDQVTNVTIWEVSALNARGQVTMANMGSNLKQTNVYDQYGLAQEMKTDRITAGNPAELMKLNFNFDAQRGNLNSRSNTAFAWNESFTYDNLDRLTGFTANAISQTHTYDNRGRIINNSNVGNYTYEGNSYQQKGLNAVTPTASTYYQDRPTQQITYNAFKSPTEIIEQGKERVSFQYNGGLQRAHMFYGNQEADKMLRSFRRHYSEDGSMEITNDIAGNKTSFVFYMGGDAYSAPAIWKEEHVNTTITSNLYFLHRDYLGSILMITNAAGEVKEKRHFDAWGNIAKLTDGNGNTLTAFLITDRGYTGHEHLLGVALIHMNGRLYDPVLHRFLSPDNYVQDPTNTQNFNRYGYVLNNPLSHIDPSGEFIPLLAIGIGALIGAASGAAGYIGSAIRTGNWNWGQFGLAVLGGAIIGGVTAGFNPMAVLGSSLTNTLAASFAGGLLPSVNFSVGNFSFSISPAIAFGQSTGIGANFSVGYSDGNWSLSAGIGFMAYGNYQGFGKGGNEIRASILAAYDDGKTGFSLGTNFWRGSNGMNIFNQQTGVLGFKSGEFSAMYENDGSIGPGGDGGDKYRTAALNISIGDFSAGFNLFTGYRDYENENGLVSKHRDPSCIDAYGRRNPNGITPEIGTKYRLGALTVGYKGYRIGVNSEHVRHAIQNQAIHNLKFLFLDKRQMGFENQSWNWNSYIQYKSPNAFSSW